MIRTFGDFFLPKVLFYITKMKIYKRKKNYTSKQESMHEIKREIKKNEI